MGVIILYYNFIINSLPPVGCYRLQGACREQDSKHGNTRGGYKL